VTLQLVRIDREPPEGFARLRAEAEAEGHRHMTRLAEELVSGATRFEALFAAFDDGELLGLGGMTREPSETSEPAFRMRRLYVSPRARRMGVARTLANALLQEALDQVALVTVHAGNDGAAAFWEAMGFETVAGQAWSHQFSPIPYSAA
jgi:GNAT superfamily N-acetyltransferase